MGLGEKRTIEEIEKDLVQLEAEKKKVIKPYYEKKASLLKEAKEVLGIGYIFQSASGIVFELAEEEGKWVAFEPVVINRTRTSDEKKGSMSFKKAEEAGFSPVLSETIF